MEKIEISGGGIAGLTAAITLAKAGKKVVVYEREKDIGKHTKINYQAFSNKDGDALEIIKNQLNIDINFKAHPTYKVTYIGPHEEAFIQSKKPSFYVIQRGGKKSVEYGLKKQAEKEGVDIQYGKNKEGRIIATGKGRLGSPIGSAFGGRYENLNLPKDMVVVILDERVAPNGYFYILPHGDTNTYTLASCGHNPNPIVYKKAFEKALLKNTKISNYLKDAVLLDKFAGIAWAGFPWSVEKNGKLYVGEAGGFQDRVAGFGMMYAFWTGYLAAKAIIDKKSYNWLWRKKFWLQLMNEFLRGWIFRNCGSWKYDLIVKGIKWGIL
jgi:flavin-dependent dehydrogenase